eukprot:CAMPEP_0203820826 /NCGR_PEP_ID=MMETSP0115-20131106/41156_1 /ASSEMBLY_ACC=CAM_ASM_000227 /TAXON_ID=33651 /ORGANISM="Bicosoecid sp, Strain ms1" /LENGTH=62 /DNA_ID=CAMNT_0050729845 /DNA_START=24 /DNA_END=209 /DNA_ORIENTATION=+
MEGGSDGEDDPGMRAVLSAPDLASMSGGGGGDGLGGGGGVGSYGAGDGVGSYGATRGAAPGA